MTFEERLARLEAIAGQLERDGLPLTQALELFEEGITHLRGAADELSRAEARVQQLVERVDGGFDVVERE